MIILNGRSKDRILIPDWTDKKILRSIKKNCIYKIKKKDEYKFLLDKKQRNVFSCVYWSLAGKERIDLLF
jgi:aspartate carbamoyltransferase regulatory subunit